MEVASIKEKGGRAEYYIWSMVNLTRLGARQIDQYLPTMFR